MRYRKDENEHICCRVECCCRHKPSIPVSTCPFHRQVPVVGDGSTKEKGAQQFAYHPQPDNEHDYPDGLAKTAVASENSEIEHHDRRLDDPHDNAVYGLKRQEELGDMVKDQYSSADSRFHIGPLSLYTSSGSQGIFKVSEKGQGEHLTHLERFLNIRRAHVGDMVSNTAHKNHCPILSREPKKHAELNSYSRSQVKGQDI